MAGRILDALNGAEIPKIAPNPDFTPPVLFPSQTDFEEFFFMGQRRYKCNQVWESGEPCEYDSYELMTVVQHAQGPHNRSGKISERVRQQRQSSILDSRGNPLIVEENPPAAFAAFRFKD